VAVVTVVFSRLLAANSSTVGFSFLMVVLGIATMNSFWTSAAVGMAATLCFNFFFLPPVGRFTIADPENWVSLFTFLLTALVASHLSDEAQKRAAEARRHQQETEQLYAISSSATRGTGAAPGLREQTPHPHAHIGSRGSG
jgi:two-component system sensor histidine kinase KdpD